MRHGAAQHLSCYYCCLVARYNPWRGQHLRIQDSPKHYSEAEPLPLLGRGVYVYAVVCMRWWCVWWWGREEKCDQSKLTSCGCCVSNIMGFMSSGSADITPSAPVAAINARTSDRQRTSPASGLAAAEEEEKERDKGQPYGGGEGVAVISSCVTGTVQCVQNSGAVVSSLRNPTTSHSLKSAQTTPLPLAAAVGSLNQHTRGVCCCSPLAMTGMRSALRTAAMASQSAR